MKLSVDSEIGKLEGVLLHTPGPEVENMTPKTAERALYSDILNLSVAREEYKLFKGVLDKVAKTFEVKDLLIDVLKDDKVKIQLLDKICNNEEKEHLKKYLVRIPNEDLATELIEGVPLKRNTLTRFWSDEYYALRPLHNFFFTRDSATTINGRLLVTRMKNRIRKRESLIVETIFRHHKNFEVETVKPRDFDFFNENVSIEGGDIIVVNKDVLVIGVGSRTSTQGVDFIIEYCKKHKIDKKIIAQGLPLSPESFIHLDMVFTFLDKDKVMVYEPVINNIHSYQTVLIEIKNGKVQTIKEELNIPTALKKIGIEVEPVFCGGREDDWNQEREQWHSGANFVAIAPGKVMGYSRNSYTLEEMNNHGFEIIHAKDILNDKIKIDDYSKCVITIDGSELSRGGGGCRCMSMPIKRSKVEW